jgi:hypothetical protein
VFWVSLQLLSQTFLILRRIERDRIINVYWCSCKVILVKILMKLDFPRQIYEKYSNIKFHENPSSGSWVVICGHRRPDMAKLIVAFRNFAVAPKNNSVLPTFTNIKPTDRHLIYSNNFAMNIHRAGAELHADRQTVVTLVTAFCNLLLWRWRERYWQCLFLQSVPN